MRSWRATTALLLLLLLGRAQSFLLLPGSRPSPRTTRWSPTRLAASTRTDYLDAVRLGIAEAGYSEEWETAAAAVVEATDGQLDATAAEIVLAQAWNWKRWAVVTSSLARKYIKTTPPDAATVVAALTWLQEGPLGLQAESLAVALTEHAAVYLAAPPETTYAQALAAAPLAYQDPVRFRETLLRDPSVLACTTNCASTGCNSDCGNCWVSFAYRS
jgi:hypothetical protein